MYLLHLVDTNASETKRRPGAGGYTTTMSLRCLLQTPLPHFLFFELASRLL